MPDEKSRANEPQPFSHSILDRHPGYAKARSGYFKAIIMNLLLIIVTIWSILPIYWGALWRPENGVHNLNGWIVDFDGGSMGQVVRQAFLNATGPKTSLDWAVVESSNFPNGQADMEHQIVNERAWAAVVIAEGATQRLQNAIAGRDSTYNGSSAVTAYAAEARNENSYRDFILPQIEQAMTAAMGAYSMQNAMNLGGQAGTLLANAPTTVLSPMNYTVDNVRPFNVEVATAVDFVGLIYLLILAFMAALASYMARQSTGLERQMKLSHLLAFRLLVPFVVYFILSLAFTLLSQFFLVPFNARFGASGFVIAWMLEYCGMLALGLAVEALVTILTPKFISFFLVLWIISNVSVSYYPLEILPTIYRYGYAMPFYNVSRAVRTIIFRTRNQVGMNFGILICWIVISCITIPLAQLYVSKKAMREEREKRGGTLNDSESRARPGMNDANRDSDATRH